MDVLAIPFRLASDLSCSKIKQSSEAHAVQQAVSFVSTRPGELPLAPYYGLNDPAFSQPSEGELRSGLTRFHPDIVVNEIQIEYDSNGSTAYINADISPVDETVSVTTRSEVIFDA